MSVIRVISVARLSSAGFFFPMEKLTKRLHMKYFCAVNFSSRTSWLIENPGDRRNPKHHHGANF
jgi:hypothetical protein